VNSSSGEPQVSRSPAEDLDERILRIAAAIGRHLAKEEMARKAGATGMPEIRDGPLEEQDD
jgi:hypothetical protein